MLFFIGDYVICLIYKCFNFIQQKYAFIPKNDNIASSFLEKSCKKGIEIVEKSYNFTIASMEKVIKKH